MKASNKFTSEAFGKIISNASGGSTSKVFGKFLNSAMALVLVLLAVGCGNSSSTNGGTGENATDLGVEELGYNPRDRWSENGSFSYDFDFSFNGSRCQTKKSFGNKADYCVGLQDQALNNSCALSARKSLYERECGNDFQEVNFQAHFFLQGFDRRLQKNCETGRPPSSTFRTAKKFCEFLKDEALHKECFWDDRLERFTELRCAGGFSAEPIATPPPAPTPTPAPGPNPTPLPREPSDPLDAIPVVKELRASGIEVTADWQAIRQAMRYPRPNQPSMQEQMKIFWSELAANKEQILQRKKTIQSVQATIYTSYSRSGAEGSLYLDVQSKPGSLAQYFPLFEKLQSFEKQLGFQFDFIHDSNSEDIAYASLREILGAVERNWTDLIRLNGTISELKTDSYAAYFSSSKTLTLRYEHLSEDLAKYVQLLKPLGPVFSWMKLNRVELDADFDLEKDADKVHAGFAVIQTQLPNFSELKKVGMLSKLTLYFVNGDHHYWGGLKDLSLSLGPADKEQVAKVMTALGKLAKMKTQINRTVELDASELDANFLKGFSLLETVWSKVVSKAAKIQELHLGYESTYYDGLKQLTIGYESSVSQTEKIIAEIK
jgi:hypothetical protein